MRTLPALLVVAAAVTACVDDVDLGTDPQAIVGGTPTTALPAIGRFVYGDDGCTAELIGPRIALTAAHCLVPPFTATAPVPGSAFVLDDGTSFAVDRVQSLASQRLEPTLFPGFVTDLAVLHLATAVPATAATPLTLAGMPPELGDVETVVGYGCTSRADRSGGGTKRYVTRTYDGDARVVCWGDSGGAALAGTLTGGGALWGETADMTSWDLLGLFPDSWIDQLAPLWYQRRQIEAVVRTWDTNELGMDRPGFSYDSVSAIDPSACRAACESDGRCRAFTWEPRPILGRCWRKAAAPEPVPHAGFVSGLPRLYEVGVDRTGGDYAAVAAPTAEACASRCGRETWCQAVTFAAGTCWLKSSVPAATACAGCTSAVIARGVEADVDHPGGDLEARTIKYPHDCAEACARDARCLAYTHGPASGTCWLKRGVTGTTAATGGATSGLRRGLEVGFDRPGATYRDVTIFSETPNLCQAECARDPVCRAWSFEPAPDGLITATCHLKDAVPTRAAAPGRVSGVRGLEFLP